MFHEYRDLVTELKTSDKHFERLFNKHNDLHDQIEKAEAGGVDHVDPFEIEKMKKEKLKLKDEMYTIIIKFKKAKRHN
jgi:uncharacterized protein YdcH (DUF465 family)